MTPMRYALVAVVIVLLGMIAGGGRGSAQIVENIRTVNVSEADITLRGGVGSAFGQIPLPGRLSGTIYTDLDQDGEVDRIASLPNATTSPLVAGVTYVRFGPDAVANVSISGDLTIAGPAFGSIMDTNVVGDVNTDGHPDLILAASAANTTDSGGSINIILGPITRPPFATHRRLFDDPADIVILADTNDDAFGWSAEWADVTGDGRGDLIVGAPLSNSVYIFRGPLQSGTRMAETADAILTDTSRSSFGIAVAAGDVTGDGIGDLVVGATPGSDVAPNVSLFEGPLTFSGVQDVSNLDQPDISGISNSRFGESIDVADLNGDGIDDLLIGDPFGGTEEQGVIYAVLGPFQSGHIVDVAVRQYLGARPEDHLGTDSSSGDVNKDGTTDITLGALDYDPSQSQIDAGGAFTFFGRPPVIDSVIVDGDLITITGSDLDASVHIDGARVAVESVSATEVQVRGSGHTIEVRGVFGTAVASRTVILSRGWNLVGWTGATAVADATATIAGAFNSLYTWDAAAQRFLSYNPDAPAIANTLRELQTGDGVWINVPTATAWEQPLVTEARSVPLQAGFNLILWTGSNGTAVTDAIAGLGSALQSLYTWDAAGQRYRSYNPSAPAFLNTAATLDYGDGVWVQVSRTATWNIPAP